MNSLPTIGEATILGFVDPAVRPVLFTRSHRRRQFPCLFEFGPAVKQRLALGFYLKGAGDA